MEKISLNIRKHRKAYIVTTVIAFLAGAIIFILYFFLQNKGLFDAINASTISFICLFCIGILMWAGSQGTFDFVAYGFRQLGASMFSKNANKYHDYPEYLSSKKTERENSPYIYLPFIVVSFLYAIALIVLEIIYHS